MTRYAFTAGGSKCYLPCIKIRKYYKNMEDGSFSSPILTEDGTLGVSVFAVTASRLGDSTSAYKVFDGTNNPWHTAQKTTGATVPFVFYSKRPIKIGSILFTNRIGDPASVYPASAVILYGSNDDITYTQLASRTNSVTSEGGQWELTVDASVAYAYHKLVFTVPYQYYALSKIALSATLGTPITAIKETDITDYDNYIDVLAPYKIDK